MLTPLIICLCIGSITHAGGIAISNSTSAATSINLSSEPPSTLSPSLFVIDDELTKLAADCISPEHHRMLTSYMIEWRLAYIYNHILFKEADTMIGLQELRSVLGFAPPGNWTKERRKKPSEEELAAAPTLEAYLEMQEPISELRGLDDEYLFKSQLPTDIAFLDWRFPTIRKIFRYKFEETLRRYKTIRRYKGKAIDRKTVDHMMEEFRAIRNRVNDAMWTMGSKTYKCAVAKLFD